MLVDVYESELASRKFLTVPAGTKLETVSLPVADATHLAKLRIFQKGMDIDPAHPRAGFNISQIINHINENGYALHEVTISVKAASTHRNFSETKMVRQL